MVLLIGMFVSNADSSLVMATHPVIASEFDDLEDSSWLFISFSLAGAATQPLYAKLSDIYGRKAVLMYSYALFAIGCAIVGIGQTMWQVLVGRLISGSGGAGLTLLAAISITDLVSLRDVASWQSYMNVVATIGRSIGGPLGGILADTIGWRWSFLGQTPFFILALLLCWLIMPSIQTPPKPEYSEESQSSRLGRIDFLGALFLGLATLSLLVPLEIGGKKLPWLHPLISLLFVLGVLFLAIFAVVEDRWAREPVFPLKLLRKKEVVLSYIVMFCQIGAQVGMMFTVPLYFQMSQRASATVAGAHLMPAVVGNAVGGVLSGWYIRRTGRYKALIIIATIISGICYLLLYLQWGVERINWWKSVYIVPGGFGTGVAQSAVFIALQACIVPEDKATASAGLFLSWPLGMMTGLAVSSAVMLGSLRAGLDGRLVEFGLDGAARNEVIRKTVANVEYVYQRDGPVGRAIIASYVEGISNGHLVSLGFVAIALIAAVPLKQHKLLT